MLSYDDFVPLFKALSDETRLKIVDLLSDGEYCACELLTAFEITQPTLSYHMKILNESGLVVSVRKGAWTKYSLKPERIDEMKKFIDELMLAPSSLGPIERSNC
ncbi:MAG: winged helix-turn-helix transcriptional regulator [Clostridiaceae bacterium]|nr:winged helix-turn-helix transcriptional regulator [Clostridiaceae bacterium]